MEWACNALASDTTRTSTKTKSGNGGQSDSLSFSLFLFIFFLPGRKEEGMGGEMNNLFSLP